MSDIDLSTITFKQFVSNCEVLKAQYQELLSPFFNLGAIKCWREMIYSLKLPEWKCDRIWECLNDDLQIEEFKKLENI